MNDSTFSHTTYAIAYASHMYLVQYYHKTFDRRRTLVCYKIVDHSDVVGASVDGAAPTTS